jgi:hypothetical protein
MKDELLGAVGAAVGCGGGGGGGTLEVELLATEAAVALLEPVAAGFADSGPNSRALATRFRS